MNQFRIVADSSCDLLTLDGADFVSVPLSIRTDTEEFYDDANLDVDAMVSTLRDTKGRSYSACPNIADWESAFGESGNVIAFTITSALSGSYNAACVAKKNCEERNPARRIYVVDSLSAGPEIALLIERALYELRSHTDFDKACEALNTYQAQTHLLFALESMHNLAQNGRVKRGVVANNKLVFNAAVNALPNLVKGRSIFYHILFDAVNADVVPVEFSIFLRRTNQRDGFLDWNVIFKLNDAD
jgi:DegV family protein with EDD domain